MVNKSYLYIVGILPKDHSVYLMRAKIVLLLFGLLCLLLADVHAEQDIQQAVTQSRRTAIVTAVERASPAVVNIKCNTKRYAVNIP